MNKCYLIVPSNNDIKQIGDEDSFIGGKPKLPTSQSIPTCPLCGAQQTFFFQIALPETNPWEGLSLAVFSCTSCADREHLIPEMLNVPLHGADIPERFLETYQSNFRFLVFETDAAKLKNEYRSKIRFAAVSLELSRDPNVNGNKVGGRPNWVLEDESPKTYAGRTPMFFLLQFQNEYKFHLLEGAPPQIELALDRTPQPSPLNYYQLFIGNALFLFGTADRQNPLVYAITQV
jgi:hypothetical protein